MLLKEPWDFKAFSTITTQESENLKFSEFKSTLQSYEAENADKTNSIPLTFSHANPQKIFLTSIETKRKHSDTYFYFKNFCNPLYSSYRLGSSSGVMFRKLS